MSAPASLTQNMIWDDKGERQVERARCSSRIKRIIFMNRELSSRACLVSKIRHNLLRLTAHKCALNTPSSLPGSGVAREDNLSRRTRGERRSSDGASSATAAPHHARDDRRPRSLPLSPLLATLESIFVFTPSVLLLLRYVVGRTGLTRPMA